jgi:hypothetical protein
MKRLDRRLLTRAVDIRPGSGRREYGDSLARLLESRLGRRHFIGVALGAVSGTVLGPVVRAAANFEVSRSRARPVRTPSSCSAVRRSRCNRSRPPVNVQRFQSLIFNRALVVAGYGLGAAGLGAVHRVFPGPSELALEAHGTQS